MEKINTILIKLDSYLGGSPWFPYLLLGTGLFFTIYLKFPQIRYFAHALRIVTGRYEKESMTGDTTHFQSLATALSGTVGTGNIGGVGLAIYIGGPAALFWMWATAFFGMTTKFVECTLSHKYRTINSDGSVSGGPMYVMEKKLKMKWLAAVFAAATVICSIGSGNLPQINNIAAAMHSTLNIPNWVTGGFLSIILALIIIGGIKRIAKVTQIIVPFMAIAYFSGAVAVIVSNFQNVWPSFIQIFSDAFSGSAATGGFLGSAFSFAFTKGVGRGIFSNEAGQGSAPIAHAAAKADEPVSEGMVSILEPFIDTLVICTLTGLVILSSGVWTQKHQNEFQTTDMLIVEGTYTDKDAAKVSKFLSGEKNARIAPYTGELKITKGRTTSDSDITIIASRSIAEDVIFKKSDLLFTGLLHIQKGYIKNSAIKVSGKSLVHSAVLTTIAFKHSFLKSKGALIVAFGLLLFAFSTVISWSYYGGRAIGYLFGPKSITPYRIVYVLAFFIGSVTDTTIIWSLAAVAVALMALPNLITLLILHKDMKQSVKEYWRDFKTEKIS
jgi:AGCS family alanine or glycine:cation symporter